MGWIKLGLLAIAALLPMGAHAQWKTPWTYEGAARWGDLDPGYAACKAGAEQSPIDIRNAQMGDLPAIRFGYHSGPLKYLINNGKTIRVNYHDAQGSGNSLIAGGDRYQLTQFHFHHPSEEYINGKPYDMEVHLMHESTGGKVVGVTVLLKAGSANATIQKIWEHMPPAEGKEEEIAGVAIDPAGLLPPNAAYYMYMGSLTAPPCTEGVTWFVLKTPVDISPAQIAQFVQLYAHDVRPIQPLNGRTVKQSK
jgi:carbonic anhydrase